MNASIKRLYERVLKNQAHPRQIALGFALGVFISLTPTLGFQTAAAVLAAAWLKWNTIAAAVGIQFTNVVTAPIIYSATYLIGARLMSLETAMTVDGLLTVAGFAAMIRQAPEILAALTLGGIVVGIPVSVLSYLCVYHVLSRCRRNGIPKFHPGTEG